MSVMARRMLTILPVLIGVSLCMFFVLTVLPGDAAEQLLGADASPRQVAELRAQLHLDGPPWARYYGWLAGVLTGDLGKSLASGLPVTSIIAERLPVTLQLVGYALLLALVFAVGAALLAARLSGGIADRVITIVGMVSLSVPNYVLAFVLVFLLAVSVPLFPSVGFAPPSEGILKNLASLTLPALAIALPLFGFYAQFLRRDLLEQMQGEAYVTTAAAKGVGPWGVLVRHALRNSLFGLLTVVGVHVGTLLGATVIIEQIFVLPGVGQLLIQAVHTRDVSVVQGIVLLIALTTAVANLIVDLLYTVLDPRVHQRAG